jgi:hypothetical protein
MYLDGKAVRREEVDCICRVCEGFWQGYLGKPHYEREMMDAGLVVKRRALAAKWVDRLQAGTLKPVASTKCDRRVQNQFSCHDCLVAAPN